MGGAYNATHNFSFSSYCYAINDPINIIDPDGKDWTMSIARDKDGNLTINLHFTGAVVNNSSSTGLDLNKFANSFRNQIKNTFSVKYKSTIIEGIATKSSGLDGHSNTSYDLKKDISINFTISSDIRVIGKESELRDNEHLISIENESNMSSEYTAGEVDKIGGKRIKIADWAAPDIISNKDKMTVPHEIGHTLGLQHVDDKYDGQSDFQKLWGIKSKHYIENEKVRNANLMRTDDSAGDGTGLTVKQMELIRVNVRKGKVNKK